MTVRQGEQMTVTASGAISFSDIMNEFNPSGGQSNIKFSDYLARNPDNPTGGGTYAPIGQGDVIYLGWSGNNVNHVIVTTYRIYVGHVWP